MKRRPLLRVVCRAADFPAVLAMAGRVLEVDELGTEADRERVHQELDALLWAVGEKARRAREERHQDALRFYASAIRRSGGSPALN